MFDFLKRSWKFVVLIFLSSHLILTLNIGVQATYISIALSKDCSRKCESEFCTVAPLLRYGKYCGLLYSGCPGEKPCDDIDNCCMLHDACVQNHHNDYLSTECSKNLLKCIAQVRNSKWQTFEGSKCKAEEVVDLITVVMEAALVAGAYLHKQ